MLLRRYLDDQLLLVIEFVYNWGDKEDEDMEVADKEIHRSLVYLFSPMVRMDKWEWATGHWVNWVILDGSGHWVKNRD
ncbi:hypothetical protein H5410_014700 [Solanum commersonii]|uniref:Uncharacterized protein n=1 Tax=Solanum commersonii TaxID=4109 RepID=A0A9J5ZS70_SOLCO|nr:hypothetical protein H5410_014700 [Solanum commersonii]